jgi:hypothetical protein
LSWLIPAFTTHSLSQTTFRPPPDKSPLLSLLCLRKIVRCAPSMFGLISCTEMIIRLRLSKSSKQTNFVHDSSSIPLNLK